MNNLLLLSIVVPILVGLLCLILPRRLPVLREALTVLTTIGALIVSIIIFRQPETSVHIPWLTLSDGLALGFDFRSWSYARLALVVIALIGFLAALYSIPFMASHKRKGEYYAYFLIAMGVTAGAVLAENLLLLLLCWELHGLLLFLMAGLNGESAIPASTRTLILAGVGDLAFLLGIGLLWRLAGSVSIPVLVAHPIPTFPLLNAAIFGLFVVAVFAKAGVMPLHSWITSISTETPMTVLSYFTSLDKMLGFYVLILISTSFFDMSSVMSTLLMAFGAITLLCGVLMAMVQSDYRKMLAFHSVSQVGYMVLGIGTGTVIGIIGGLLHLINMIVVKGSLFLCGGSIEYRTGKTRFSEMGGLAGAMPLTFAATLVASLAIAGVPPLNAFVSKWFIYQGILDRGGLFSPLFLLMAMFGSALTLASFMKLLYSMFWGDKPGELNTVKESPWLMTFPILVLAVVAIGFGIFYSWPVNVFLAPILGVTDLGIKGLWQSSLAVILMVVSLLAGLVVYWFGQPRRSTQGEVFVGGELIDQDVMRVPGTHFYGPVKAMKGLSKAFSLAEAGALDFYQVACRLVKVVSDWIYKYIDQALTDFYQEVIPALFSLIGQVLRVLNTKMVLTRLLWILYALGVVAFMLFPAQSEVVALIRIAACAGMIGWAFLAWVEEDLTRMLILAATSQLGFVVLGITISNSVAVSYLLTSSLAIVVLFASARLIQQKLHTGRIEDMSGLAVKMPVIFVFFVLAALWLSGLPPFGSFFSKFLLGVAAGDISPFLTIAITGAAILTLGYLLRPIRRFLNAG
jgi:formate hydrogenlyase subunit 3/multisubunit Na+/H+ antiporter MnhD subunit